MALAVNALDNSIPPHFVFARKIYYSTICPWWGHRLHRIMQWVRVNAGEWLPDIPEALCELHQSIPWVKSAFASWQPCLPPLAGRHQVLQSQWCGAALLSPTPSLLPQAPGPGSQCFRPPEKIHQHSYGSLYDGKSWKKPWSFITYQVLWQQSAATPSNITAGFRCTGIWPFKPNIFGERDVSPAYVTDGLAPSTTVEPAPPAPDEPARTPSLFSAFHSTAEAKHEDFSPKVHQYSRLDLERSRERGEKDQPPFSLTSLWSRPWRRKMQSGCQKQEESYLYRKNLPSLQSREVVFLMQLKNQNASPVGRTSSPPGQVKFACSAYSVWAHEACTDGCESE